jgi:hypothetical protein
MEQDQVKKPTFPETRISKENQKKLLIFKMEQELVKKTTYF